MQCVALFAFAASFFWRTFSLHLVRVLLLAGAIFVTLYAWHDADFVLGLGQILLAAVLWSALPSHATHPDGTSNVVIRKDEVSQAP